MLASAQISLYPLRQSSLSPAIEKTIGILTDHGLDVTAGPMSTIVSGDDVALFDALGQAFRINSEQGDFVMVVTFSNACPLVTKQ
jgi:uncharacterized protein YqgV (UPF0045/DUF77 family)